MKPELHMNRDLAGLYARAARRRLEAIEAMDMSPEVREAVLSFHALANGMLDRLALFHGTSTTALLTPPAGGDGDDSTLDSGGTDKP